MSRTVRAGEARLMLLDDTRLVEAFVRRQLSEAAPLTERIEDERRALFDGVADRVRFVGHLPAHRGGGGLQFLELALRVPDRGEAPRAIDPDARDLVLYHCDAWPEMPFEGRAHDSPWEAQTLVADVKRLRFRYYGNVDDKSAAEWRDSWTGVDRLPMLVQVEVEASDGHGWPPIVAAVRSRIAAGQPGLLRLHTGSVR
jgi:general secretion pathway protein J